MHEYKFHLLPDNICMSIIYISYRSMAYMNMTSISYRTWAYMNMTSISYKTMAYMNIIYISYRIISAWASFTFLTGHGLHEQKFHFLPDNICMSIASISYWTMAYMSIIYISYRRWQTWASFTFLTGHGKHGCCCLCVVTFLFLHSMSSHDAKNIKLQLWNQSLK